MSHYLPPLRIVPIFNASDYTYGNNYITRHTADDLYLNVRGDDIDYGVATFRAGILTDTIGSDQGADMTITCDNDLILNPTGSVDCNGKTLNMTAGEIHNCPLIHSQNNNDIVIEGKGTGDVVIKTGNTERVRFYETGDVAVDTNVLFVDAVNNRIGINKSSPTVPLDVVGNALITGNTVISNNLTVDTNTLYVDATNNRVGVGTASPSDTLQVVGNAFLSGGTSSLYLNATSSASNYMRVFHIQSGAFTGGYIDWLGGDFQIRRGDSGVNQMSLTNAGVMTLAGGLVLPTSGGTATTLTYYEEATVSLTFGFTTNSGTTQTVSCLFTRVGDKVTVVIPAVNINCGNQARTEIPNTSAFATRFRPATRITVPAIVNFNNVATSARCDILTTGFFYFSYPVNTTNFQFANCGWPNSVSLSWVI